MGQVKNYGAPVTLTERQCLHTLRVGQLIVYASSMGVSIKVLEWNRDIETQKRYVSEGVSKTMDSRHIDNCATDFVVVISGSTIFVGNDSPEEHKAIYRVLGTYAESRGLRWGGRFVDRGAFKEKHGREFDSSKDLGWDCGHVESPDTLS